MYEVIGIEKVDYTNKMGRRVQGIKLHCTFVNDNRIDGLGVESIYCSSGMLGIDDIEVGSIIEPFYNKYGNVASIHRMDTNN